MGSQITVVITNYKRPEHLRNAVNSCIMAGVENVVISASGEDDALRLMHDKIRAKRPQWIIDSIKEDRGCNEMWLRGVRHVKTPWVHILHDDDVLLRSFVEDVEKMTSEDVGFIHWSGEARAFESGTKTGEINYLTGVPQGIHSPKLLNPHLQNNESYAISPVLGLFRPWDLIETLEECENIKDDFQLRPNMMVGNDTLIWMRAVEKYDRFGFIPKPQIAFGSWRGSTTWVDIHLKQEKLLPLYRKMRQYFRNHPKQTDHRIKIHFFTIVLDGMPWIAHHLPILNSLPSWIDWTWHVVEGVAAPVKDTKWCKPIAPRLSKDGTHEYLKSLSTHPRVKHYYREQWDGKVEMCNTPLSSIKDAGLLWQIDSDELWTASKIERIATELERTSYTCADFKCRYFVGHNIIMNHVKNTWTNEWNGGWRRVWKFSPGMKFLTHEPAVLSGSTSNPMSAEHTEQAGVLIDHYAYATEAQLRFKEKYYGYSGAVEGWRKLQSNQRWPAQMKDFFPWVKDNATARLLYEH